MHIVKHEYITINYDNHREHSYTPAEHVYIIILNFYLKGSIDDFFNCYIEHPNKTLLKYYPWPYNTWSIYVVILWTPYYPDTVCIGLTRTVRSRFGLSFFFFCNSMFISWSLDNPLGKQQHWYFAFLNLHILIWLFITF